MIGALIYFMSVFTVWAFGSVYTYSLDWFSAWDWAVRFMTGCSYFLLVVFLIKKFLIWKKISKDSELKHRKSKKWKFLGVMCFYSAGALVVIHAAASVLNARAVFDPAALNFVYQDNYISWLPHSYDKVASTRAFWEYSGLFFYFLVLRHWLLEPSKQAFNSLDKTPRSVIEGSLPDRHRRFLMLLGINLSLVALVGIVQRLSGSNELLWLVKPHINIYTIQQFGPYAYRGNAAQIFNLIWPAFLAIVLFSIRKSVIRGSIIRSISQNATVALVPLLIVLIISPVVTSSRAGAGLMLVAMLAVVFIVLKNSGRINLKSLTIAGMILSVTVAMAWWLGGEQLKLRFKRQGISSDRRIVSRELAKEMAKDYFWLGSGGKSFSNLFELYTETPQQARGYFHLHDDYLEFLINFGVITFSAVILGLILVLTYFWWGPSGFKVSSEFHSLILVGMATCLIHARIDFPFQVHSILFYFVSLCGIMTTIRKST